MESHRLGRGGHNIDGSVHMDVPIEISDGTPGVMAAVDGAEVSLQ